jgi:Fe2+ or Zn2+ uptake regulation protein
MPFMSQSKLQDLKNKGHRLTKARIGLLEVLDESNAPLSAASLMEALKRKKIRANLSTLYRELTFLAKQGLVHETTFDKKTRVFERKEAQDHHHAVCENCHTVIELDIEPSLKQLELAIAKKTKFKANHHLVEFFGTCASCQ